MRRLAKRRHAVATASPFVTAVLAVADSFVYMNETLSYTIEELDSLRILRLDGIVDREIVVDTHNLMLQAVEYSCNDWKHRFTPLHVSGNIVSGKLSCAGHDRWNNFMSGTWLVVFDIDKTQVVSNLEFDPSKKVFVRGNQEHVYFGTRDIGAIEGFSESCWLLDRLDISTRTWTKDMRLSPTLGHRIGVDVCFEVFGDALYVVATEQEWGLNDTTAFLYRAWCVSPKHLETAEFIGVAIDRGVRDGAILDERWQTLSIHRDEGSGELFIYETRVESFDGDTQWRCAYRTPLPAALSDNANADGLVFEGLYLFKDKFDPVRSAELIFCYHAISDNLWTSILSTPMASYNPATGAFVDLITDPPGMDDWSRSLQRLRLRVRSPQPSRGDALPSIAKGQVLYSADGTQLRVWPPNDPSHFNVKFDKACSMLSPQGAVRSVEWAADGRHLVYSPKPFADTQGPRPVMLMSFDPTLRLEGTLSLLGDFEAPPLFDPPSQDAAGWRFVERPYYTVIQDADNCPLRFDLSFPMRPGQEGWEDNGSEIAQILA